MPLEHSPEGSGFLVTCLTLIVPSGSFALFICAMPGQHVLFYRRSIIQSKSWHFTCWAELFEG